MSAPADVQDLKTAARDAMTVVLDRELQPGGKPVDLSGLLARAVAAGAVAIEQLIGDDDADRLLEALSRTLPDVGFDWADALTDGFPDDVDELDDGLRDTVTYEDDVLDSFLEEFFGAPRWVGGVSPNPYSRMACSIEVLAITWKGAVWFFERGDMDGMDRNWAGYAYTVGDNVGERTALVAVAERWAGGDLCDHPDPGVRSAARDAYLASRFDAPWNSPTSGWDDLMADSAETLASEYGEALAEAIDTTPQEAERLVRSIKAHGPGDDPEVDTAEAALELWWLTGNWTSWWG